MYMYSKCSVLFKEKEAEKQQMALLCKFQNIAGKKRPKCKEKK